MSYNCSLSNAKISAWASVIVSEKWKASVSDQNFGIELKDVPVKDILASVEDGLWGIFSSEADLIRGKVVSSIQKATKISFDEKRTHGFTIVEERSEYNNHQGLQA